MKRLMLTMALALSSSVTGCDSGPGQPSYGQYCHDTVIWPPATKMAKLYGPRQRSCPDPRHSLRILSERSTYLCSCPGHKLTGHENLDIYKETFGELVDSESVNRY